MTKSVTIEFKQDPDGTWQSAIVGDRDANAYVVASMLLHHRNNIMERLEARAKNLGFPDLKSSGKEVLFNTVMSDIYTDEEYEQAEDKG